MSPPDLTDAACRHYPASWWHPDDGTYTPRSQSVARNICGTCPIQTACLAWALHVEAATPGSRWGMYGGLTPDERAELARRG